MSGLQPEGRGAEPQLQSWQMRTRGVWQAPTGSCVSSSCALSLRAAGETHKSKPSLQKTTVTQSTWLEMSWCLKVGISTKQSLSRGWLVVFLNALYTAEEFKVFLGCCRS